MITFIITNGPPADIDGLPGEMDLEDLQKLVDGYIEVVALPNGDQLVVNEEGKLKGLPVNPVATALFREAFPDIPDVIVGRAVLLTGRNRLT